MQIQAGGSRLTVAGLGRQHHLSHHRTGRIGGLIGLILVGHFGLNLTRTGTQLDGFVLNQSAIFSVNRNQELTASHPVGRQLVAGQQDLQAVGHRWQQGPLSTQLQL